MPTWLMWTLIVIAYIHLIFIDRNIQKIEARNDRRQQELLDAIRRLEK